MLLCDSVGITEKALRESLHNAWFAQQRGEREREPVCQYRIALLGVIGVQLGGSMHEWRNWMYKEIRPAGSSPGTGESV